MKSISFRPAPPRADGFTIVELIVSLTVLALVLVFTAQLINGTSRAIAAGSKRTDADSQSRLVFSRLGQDVARLVKRSDVDFSTFKQPDNPQAGPDAQHGANDQLAFYSETGGGYTPAAGASAGSFSTLTARAPLSVVAYQVAAEPNGGSTTLRRMAKALGWDPDPDGAWACPVYLPLKLGNLRVNGNPIQLFSDRPTDPTSPVDPDYATLGDMVFRFEYRYLLKPNPTNNPVPACPSCLTTPRASPPTPPSTGFGTWPRSWSPSVFWTPPAGLSPARTRPSSSPLSRTRWMTRRRAKWIP